MFVFKVLSREALHKLRWCKTTHPVLSGALWMPIGRFSTIHFLVFFLCISICPKNLNRFDLALRTDRPVVGRPHAWSLPTIYRFGSHLLQCSDFFVSCLILGYLVLGHCQQYIGLQKMKSAVTDGKI